MPGARRSTRNQRFATAPIASAFVAVLLGVLLGFRPARPESAAPKLHLEQVGADSTAFHVVATMIVGPTEVLVWDAHYHAADAERLAARIAATGKKLTAVIISHPDHDHYMGAAKIVERFPGTPVYMTAAGLAEFQRTAARQFQGEKARQPALIPDSLVTPKVIPSTHFTVDGEAVDIVPDLTGDVMTPTNSFLWIPSLRAALAGDIVFNGIHPWLGASNEASRTAWHAAIKRIADLHPAIVVAGHKKDVSAANSPDALAFMDRYLSDFDAAKQAAANGDELRAAMLQKYPDLAVRVLLAFGARAAFQK
jgi:glyoxylase-like metal-dependent hydrolase (beta-lactamase superfamily II)